MSNIETVQALYSAFGTGDIAAILDLVSDDVSWDAWDPPSDAQRRISFLAERRGRDEVAGFFGLIAETFDFKRFEPREFYESAAGGVVARILFEAEVKATGKTVSDIEVHVWSFDEDGKVASFRHVLDTLKNAEALS